MFVASYRRTESNPRTIAAIKAQRQREQARLGIAQRIKPLPKLNVVAPVLKADKPKTIDLSDNDIAAKIAAKWPQFLQDVMNAATPTVKGFYRPDFNRILVRISRVFGATPEEILSPSRRKDLTLPRRAVYYWAHRLTPLGFSAIGNKMSGRDHSTIIYGVEAYRENRAEHGRYLRSTRGRT